MNREDIMANNNATSENVVTKYDRKMKKEKKLREDILPNGCV